MCNVEVARCVAQLFFLPAPAARFAGTPPKLTSFQGLALRWLPKFTPARRYEAPRKGTNLMQTRRNRKDYGLGFIFYLLCSSTPLVRRMRSMVELCFENGELATLELPGRLRGLRWVQDGMTGGRCGPGLS